MGGTVCKQICKRQAISGDALDAQQAAGKLSLSVTHAGNALQAASYRAAQEAVQAVELSPSNKRAAAWKECDAIWEAAIKKGEVEASQTVAKASAAPVAVGTGPYAEAKAAVAALEVAPGASRAAAWKVCDAAWEAAVNQA